MKGLLASDLMAKTKGAPGDFHPEALALVTLAFYLTCRSKFRTTDLLGERVHQIVHGGVGVALGERRQIKSKFD